MAKLMWAVILAALVIIVLKVPITPEARSWEHAEISFTVSSFENYLSSYPDGAHSQEAKLNIENLKQAVNLTPIKYEGRVWASGSYSNRVTLIKATGELMVLYYNDDAVIENDDRERKKVSDLEMYDALKGNYVVLPDGTFLAQGGRLSEKAKEYSCRC